MKLDAFNTLNAMARSFANEETAKEAPFVFAIKSPDGVAVQTCVDTHSFINLYRGITEAFVRALKDSGGTRSSVSNLIAMACAEATAKHFPLKAGDLEELSGEAVEKLDELLEGLKEALGMGDEE